MSPILSLNLFIAIKNIVKTKSIVIIWNIPANCSKTSVIPSMVSLDAVSPIGGL